MKTCDSSESAHLWSRRDFFSLAGWAVLLSVVAGFLLAFIRSMFPRVLFERSTVFKAGYPDDYIVGTISEKYKESHGVWIARTDEGFYALSAVCTHLGCVPRWQGAENKFRCPCHGSGFYKNGINFEGPAPRALERLKIHLSDNGELQVDKSKILLYEKGEWEESVLKV